MMFSKRPLPSLSELWLRAPGVTGCRPGWPKLIDRIKTLPQAVRDIAWKGQMRMCQRYRHMMAAGKPKVVATTAIAREMVGFIWAIAREVTSVSA